MKEIEILVEVYDDEEKIMDRLSKFKYIGQKKIVDVYYYDPLRKKLKPDTNKQLNECLRLRSKNAEYSVTYKVDKFDENGKWLYSDEYESNIDSYNHVEAIFENLGLKELLRIENEKETYEYGDYEIVFEKVKNLGKFIEVEYCTSEDIDVIKIKKSIQEFIDNLGLNVSPELNMGKPEMMLKRSTIVVE